MKKFAISLLALAAVSTVALASNRDVTTPAGAVDTHQSATVSASNALAVPAGSNSAYDLELGGSNRR
ncbi:MAG: hypothetical protein ABL936_09455 [Aestuariivirga sp.]